MIYFSFYTFYCHTSLPIRFLLESSFSWLSCFEPPGSVSISAGSIYKKANFSAAFFGALDLLFLSAWRSFFIALNSESFSLLFLISSRSCKISWLLSRHLFADNLRRSRRVISVGYLAFFKDSGIFCNYAGEFILTDLLFIKNTFIN